MATQAEPGMERRARLRRTPQRDAAFANVSLADLRSFRRAAIEEETRVSYWRRLVQARLDLLRSGDDGSDVARLGRVLADKPGASRRQAFVRITPPGDMPPLPELEELWRRATLASEADRPHAISDLEGAEHQLSEYRSALHQRIGAATEELVARYREQPSLCLDLLPLVPQMRQSA